MAFVYLDGHSIDINHISDLHEYAGKTIVAMNDRGPSDSIGLADGGYGRTPGKLHTITLDQPLDKVIEVVNTALAKAREPQLIAIEAADYAHGSSSKYYIVSNERITSIGAEEGRAQIHLINGKTLYTPTPIASLQAALDDAVARERMKSPYVHFDTGSININHLNVVLGDDNKTAYAYTSDGERIELGMPQDQAVKMINASLLKSRKPTLIDLDANHSIMYSDRISDIAPKGAGSAIRFAADGRVLESSMSVESAHKVIEQAAAQSRSQAVVG